MSVDEANTRPITAQAATETERQAGRSLAELREALAEGSGRALVELQRRGEQLPSVDRDPVWL